MLTEINNLLDINTKADLHGKIIGIAEENASATFMTHYFLNHFLRNDQPVVFVGMSQTFSHYNSVAQKFGINLVQQRDNGLLVFIESLKFIGEATIGENTEPREKHSTQVDNPFSSLVWDKKLKDVYLHLKSKANDVRLAQKKDPTLIIDDMNIFSDIGVTIQELFVFTQYLKSEFVNNYNISNLCEGSLILFSSIFHKGHEDDSELLWRFINHICSVSIQVNGLESGYCKEIDGEICVKWRTVMKDKWKTKKRMHFKLSDKNVTFFAPGMSPAVL